MYYTHPFFPRLYSIWNLCENISPCVWPQELLTQLWSQLFSRALLCNFCPRVDSRRNYIKYGFVRWWCPHKYNSSACAFEFCSGFWVESCVGQADTFSTICATLLAITMPHPRTSPIPSRIEMIHNWWHRMPLNYQLTINLLITFASPLTSLFWRETSFHSSFHPRFLGGF